MTLYPKIRILEVMSLIYIDILILLVLQSHIYHETMTEFCNTDTNLKFYVVGLNTQSFDTGLSVLSGDGRKNRGKKR